MAACSEKPINTTLRVGYTDDYHANNGYWSRDSGNDCDTNVTAWIELDVKRNSGLTMVTLPWDMAPGCVDDNYIFADPHWGWQKPSDTDSYSQRTFSDSDALANSSQITGYDGPPSGLKGFLDDLLDLQFEKLAVCGSIFSTNGHRNWMDATYSAQMKCCKPPRAAVVKSHGGERRGKRRG